MKLEHLAKERKTKKGMIDRFIDVVLLFAGRLLLFAFSLLAIAISLLLLYGLGYFAAFCIHSLVTS